MTHRSSWALQSSIHTRSCWATTRSTRAAATLAQGEAEINRIGQQLRAAGRL